MGAEQSPKIVIIDESPIRAVMLSGQLVALRAQPGDDALGIHQRLGAPEGHETDFWGDALIHSCQPILGNAGAIPNPS